MRLVVRCSVVGLGVAVAVLAGLLWGPDPRDAQVARADLEVTLPPGLAPAWFRELPLRSPFFRGGRVIGPPAEDEAGGDDDDDDDKKGGSTVRRGKKRKKLGPELEVTEHAETEYGASYQPMFFAGVKTEDLPIHLTWVSRKPDTSPAAYPPAVTDDLYWMAQAAYLRRLLHPSLVGEREILWPLIALGQAAREVGGPARGEAFLTPLIEEVEKRIPKLPAARPAVPKDYPGGDEEKMLLQVVLEDLSRGDALTLDPTFAGRLLSRGEELFDHLAFCAAMDHPLLRRNAAVVLGGYQHEGALPALRAIFREDLDKDAVASTRALFQLVRRQDRDIVSDLQKMLASDDRYRRPLAAWALGEIADPNAASALVEALTRDPADDETITAAVEALGRLGDKSDEVIKALKTLQSELSASTPRFEQDRAVPRPQADIPDAVALRNRLCLEMTVVALARLGDRSAEKDVLSLLKGGWTDSKNPRGHANASGPDRGSQCDALRNVCPTTIPSLCEALAVMGSKGEKHLEDIVEHAKTSEKLRVLLLGREPLRSDKGLLKKLALGDFPAPVQASAIKRLYNVDPKTGGKIAQNVIARFAKGQNMSKTRPEGNVTVIAALEILFQQEKLKGSILKAVLARALKPDEHKYQPPEITAEGVKPFQFSPPILQVTVALLGVDGEKSSLSILRRIAKDDDLPVRAEAALALGSVPGGDKVLLDLLDDKDPWVRYSAYLGLQQQVGGKGPFADWIYGSKRERGRAVDEWEKLVKGK